MKLRAHFIHRASSTLLMSVLLAASIGCGAANTASSGTTTQPASPIAPTSPPASSLPPVPVGWTNLASHWFSFSYPSGWQLIDKTSANPPFAIVAEPSLQHQFLIEFQPGIVNQAGVLDQCAGARQALVDFYNANILPLNKTVGQSSSTTTTYEPNYGFLGGVEIQIHVVSTPASSGPNFNLWLNAIQRTDGLYLVGYRDPGDALDVWVAARKKFTDTIYFNSPAAPSSAPCNYKV